MRIIAGSLKGRRLIAPKGQDVRPTSDSLRETLFNILGPSVAGARVLDGFAGTGALGLEALSRGAASVVFVERDAHAFRALEANVAACRVQESCAIIRGDFLNAPMTAPFNLILLDPPYSIDGVQVVLDHGASWLDAGGRIVFEHSRRRESPDAAGETRDVVRYRVLTAGDSALSFYARP